MELLQNVLFQWENFYIHFPASFADGTGTNVSSGIFFHLQYFGSDVVTQFGRQTARSEGGSNESDRVGIS